MSESDRLVVVSNRLPVVLSSGDQGWSVRPGSGGLVTALAPVLRNRGGLWLGWPGLPSEDLAQADLPALMQQGQRESGYELSPVHLSREEVEGFYEGFANAILWPLFHDRLGNCDFEPRYWQAYLDANRHFAEAVRERSGPDDFVWVHDYHLIHVGLHLREHQPNRRIGFFLHIPFPPLDLFLRLPWREPMLRALLAYDLLGFQTRRDQRNFLTCLQHLLPDVELATDGPLVQARAGDRTVRIGAFPISIDFEHFASAAATPDALDRMAELAVQMEGQKVIVGIDRLDYSKGLLERLHAYALLLQRHRELRERVVLLQTVVPSREGVTEYQALKARIERLVGEINGRYTTPGWVPVHYVYRSLPWNSLVALYRLADVALVTPLKDGMNLVAKEYCACQVDETGVLVLSEFAGSAAQLRRGALLVNPYDTEGTADTLHRALTLPVEERTRRMRRLRSAVRHQDIFWWVDRYLRAAFDRALEEFPGQEEYLPRLRLDDVPRLPPA